jgi:hypothetical protein
MIEVHISYLFSPNIWNSRDGRAGALKSCLAFEINGSSRGAASLEIEEHVVFKKCSLGPDLDLVYEVEECATDRPVE